MENTALTRETMLYFGHYRIGVFTTMMKIPERVPEKGFYYHYKHNPAGPVNNYAYEVIGVGCHTEAVDEEVDANMVVYRPLYESAFVYEAGKLFDLRPLEMFMEEVTKDGKTFPRFKEIVDPVVISKLKDIKKQLYGDSDKS